MLPDASLCLLKELEAMRDWLRPKALTIVGGA